MNLIALETFEGRRSGLCLLSENENKRKQRKGWYSVADEMWERMSVTDGDLVHYRNSDGWTVSFILNKKREVKIGYH